MKKIKNLLITGSIISLLIMIFYFSLNLKVLYILYLISTLISFYLYTNEDKILIKNKKILLVLAIINIFLSIPVSIIYFVAYSELKNISKTENFSLNSENITDEEIIPPKNKKIDILMKFGVFLVILSGIIFSTSITNTKLDVLKPMFIVLLSVLFKALEYFFKHKVKIKTSEKTYSILSDLFILFFVISLGYFQTLGNYLSFFGNGKLLMYSVVSLVASFVTLKLDNKIKINSSKEISLSFIFLSILILLLHLNIEYIYITSIFSLLSLFIYYYKDKLYSYFDNTNNFLSIIVLISYLNYYKQAFIHYNFNLIYILNGIILLYSLYLRIKNNASNKFINKTFPILSTLFVLVTTYYIGNYINNINNSIIYIINDSGIINYDFINLIFMLILNNIFLKIKNKDISKYGFYYTYIILILLNINLLLDKTYLMSLLSSIILFAYSLMNIIINKDKCKEKVFIFTEIITLLFASISCINYYVLITNNETHYSITMIIFTCALLLFSVAEEKRLKKLKLNKYCYYLVLILLMIFNTLYMSHHSNIFNIIILIILIIYKYLYLKEDKYNYVLDYLIVINSFLHISNLLLTYTNIYITSILLCVSILILSYYTKNDKKLSSLTIMLLYIPYLSIILNLSLSEELFVILTRLPIIFLIFNFTRNILNKNSNLLEITLILILFATHIFMLNIYLGIYTGILGLIMTFIGFKYDKFYSLFVSGIIVVILDIIIQLIEFWSKIPIFVYLLISGLFIIGYVTYKELNKDKIKKIKLKDIAIIKEEKIDTLGNILCTSLIVVTLVTGIIYNNLVYNNEKNILSNNFKNDLIESGIDVSKIYYHENVYDELYILEGYYFSIEKYKEVYNKHFEEKEIRVSWITKDCLDKFNQDGSCNYLGLLETQTYSQIPNKTYNINEDIEINVTNKDIDFLEMNYFSYKDTLKLNYNVYDIENLNICINNKSDNIYIYFINRGSDIEIINFDDDNCFDISSLDGDIELSYIKYIEPIEETTKIDNN